MSTAAMKTVSVVVSNLKEAEAATYLGISVHSLRRWRVYGGGPKFCKMGSRVTYLVSELESFQASCLRRSTSDQGETELVAYRAKRVQLVRKNKENSDVNPSNGLPPRVEGQGGEA